MCFFVYPTGSKRSFERTASRSGGVVVVDDGGRNHYDRDKWHKRIVTHRDANDR